MNFAKMRVSTCLTAKTSFVLELRILVCSAAHSRRRFLFLRFGLHDGAHGLGDVSRFDERKSLRRADLISALLWDDAGLKAQTVHLAQPRA